MTEKFIPIMERESDVQHECETMKRWRNSIEDYNARRHLTESREMNIDRIEKFPGGGSAGWYYIHNLKHYFHVNYCPQCGEKLEGK